MLRLALKKAMKRIGAKLDSPLDFVFTVTAIVVLIGYAAVALTIMWVGLTWPVWAAVWWFLF